MLTVIETFEHAGRISLLAAAAVLPIPATGQHDSGVLHTWPAGLVSVQLTGAVIVSGNDPHATYFLDNDEDEVADYRLVFGPSWYEPDSGASRPSHGDTVTIVGSVNDHDATPRLVVFELNGERWRASVEYGMHGWNAMPFWTEQGDTLTASGTVQVDTTYFYHHYYLDTDADGRPEYELGLGPQWYRPHSAAEWPRDGQLVTVWGIVHFRPGTNLLSVYELDGQAWRDKGGTAPWAGNWHHSTHADTTWIFCANDSLQSLAFPAGHMHGMGMSWPDSSFTQFWRIHPDSLPVPGGLHHVIGFYVDAHDPLG